MATKSGGKTIFWGKLPENSEDTLRVKNFVEIAPSRSVSKINSFFAFNEEIQKWRKNDFCEKSPVDSANILWVNNFVKIALSGSVSEINAFLRFQR